MNSVTRNVLRSIAGFVGWAVSSSGKHVFPVYNTDARALVKSGLLGSQLDSEVKADLTLLLDAQKEDVRLVWNNDIDALQLSFNGGSLGAAPQFNPYGTTVAEITANIVADFDLYAYKTVVSVNQLVHFTEAEAAVLRSVGGCAIHAFTKVPGSFNLDSVLVAGLSRANYHGVYKVDGTVTAPVWQRNPVLSANVRLPVINTTVFAEVPAALGVSAPSVAIAPYGSADWGDTTDSYHLEKNGRRATLHSRLRVYGAAVVPADETFTLYADAVLPALTPGYGTLRGTWDIPMSAVKTAAVQAANDARTSSDTSLAEREAARQQASEIPDDSSIWRLTVTEPFTVPMIGDWHSDLKQLDNDKVFLPKYSWSRRTWDAQFAGRQHSLFAAIVIEAAGAADIRSVVVGVDVSFVSGDLAIAMADLPVDAIVIAAGEDAAVATEAALEAGGRDDVLVVTENVKITGEIHRIPLFSYDRNSKSSAERFIALKADVRSKEAERMLLGTVWAAQQASARFFGGDV